jgi:hypothetical protein
MDPRGEALHRLLFAPTHLCVCVNGGGQPQCIRRWRCMQGLEEELVPPGIITSQAGGAIAIRGPNRRGGQSLDANDVDHLSWHCTRLLIRRPPNRASSAFHSSISICRKAHLCREDSR